MALAQSYLAGPTTPAPHKMPKHGFVVEAFPLTGSGKIQKFKLREAWIKGEMTSIWCGGISSDITEMECPSL